MLEFITRDKPSKHRRLSESFFKVTIPGMLTYRQDPPRARESLPLTKSGQLRSGHEFPTLLGSRSPELFSGDACLHRLSKNVGWMRHGLNLELSATKYGPVPGKDRASNRTKSTEQTQPVHLAKGRHNG